MADDPNPYALAVAAFAEGHPGPVVEFEQGARIPNMLSKGVQRLIQDHRTRTAEQSDE